jgi:hypothetical protein
MEYQGDNDIQNTCSMICVHDPKSHNILNKIGIILITLSYILPIYLIIDYNLYAYDPGWDMWEHSYLASAICFIAALFSMVFMLLFFVFFHKVLSYYGYKLRQQNAIDLLNTDSRAPILYLRSFNDDSVPDYSGSIVPFGPQYTVEMRIAHVLRMIGPVISIGSPGEHIQELGANRFYVADNYWKQAVRYFLDKSAAIVILVGSSRGVGWEISTALQIVPIEKILLVFPFIISKPKGFIQSIRRQIDSFKYNKELEPLDENFLHELRGERDARYADFCARFGHLFKKKLPQDIGSSIFIDFTESGDARLIPTQKPLFSRTRDKQLITIDYERSLHPFIEKMEKTQNKKIQRSRIKSLFTNSSDLLAFTVFNALVAIVCIFLQIYLDLSGNRMLYSSMLIILFLALTILGLRILVPLRRLENQGK